MTAATDRNSLPDHVALPATSAQINYAKSLGIFVTGTETLPEMSEKISTALDPRRSIVADDECLAYATAFGVGRAKDHTRDSVLWRITQSVAVSGREFDLARWYMFRVYHSASGSWTDLSLELTLDGPLARMADEFLLDRKSVDAALREVKRSNLDCFSATRPLDEHGAHRVASTRTSAYKHAIELLTSHGYIRESAT